MRKSIIIIGSIYNTGMKADRLLTNDILDSMTKGAIIMDVAIDQGGITEQSKITSIDEPIIEYNGVNIYCVPNIPSRYSKTASLSISNIITPFLLQIAEDGGIEKAIRYNIGLKNGVYTYHGILTNKAIGEWFSLNYSDINLIVF